MGMDYKECKTHPHPDLPRQETVQCKKQRPTEQSSKVGDKHGVCDEDGIAIAIGDGDRQQRRRI